MDIEASIDNDHSNQLNYFHISCCRVDCAMAFFQLIKQLVTITTVSWNVASMNPWSWSSRISSFREVRFDCWDDRKIRSQASTSKSRMLPFQVSSYYSEDILGKGLHYLPTYFFYDRFKATIYSSTPSGFPVCFTGNLSSLSIFFSNPVGTPK